MASTVCKQVPILTSRPVELVVTHLVRCDEIASMCPGRVNKVNKHHEELLDETPGKVVRVKPTCDRNQMSLKWPRIRSRKWWPPDGH